MTATKRDCLQTLIVIGLTFCAIGPLQSAKPSPIVDLPLKICGDAAEWPPFHFQKEGEFKGYDLDVLHAILDPLNVTFEFSMPPWKRCLVGTAVGEYQVAVSASYSIERDQTFIMTEAYYSTTPAVVTTRGFLPERIEITLEELKQWRVCGVHGYNYNFVDVNTLNMVFRGPGYAQTIKKLGGKPCDVVLARKETLLGFNNTMGVQMLNQQHLVLTIKSAKTDPFYLLISRQYRQADQLKKIFNRGLKSLQSSGKLEAMLNKYL